MASADTPYQWERQLRSRRAGPALVGYIAIAVLIGGFGYWAATAPISGAAVAPGVIAAAGRNVTVQHLEGGVVASIRVQEGDYVEAGDTLALLDDTLALSERTRLDLQSVRLRAMEARLIAERDGLNHVPPTANGGAPEESEAVTDQNKEFAARLERYRSEQAILRQRQTALEEGLAGLAAQEAAIEDQLVIVEEELAGKQRLLDQGLTNRFEFTQIQRGKADLIGQLGVIRSEMAAGRVQIIEAREQIERLATQRVEHAVTQLNEVRSSLADVEEQLSAARAIVERTVITAPATGVVVSSVFNAVGSVVTPGQTLLDILPTTDETVVEARLQPHDIDRVAVGQATRLRLSALNLRLTPEVDGAVIHISADRIVDEATMEPYYRARIRITDALPPNVERTQLYPGMPVEAFINTGERTFFEYLARPILDSLSRAFTER